jgi:hypothetical protein
VPDTCARLRPSLEYAGAHVVHLLRRAHDAANRSGDGGGSAPNGFARGNTPAPQSAPCPSGSRVRQVALLGRNDIELPFDRRTQS